MRYYIKRTKLNQYICHHCKVIDNGPVVSKILREKNLGKFNSNDLIEVSCNECRKEYKVKYKNVIANKRRNNGIYRCVACSLSLAHKDGKFKHIYTDEFKKGLNNISNSFWNGHRSTWKEELVTDDFRKAMSGYGKLAHKRPFEKPLLSIPIIQKKQLAISPFVTYEPGRRYVDSDIVAVQCPCGRINQIRLGVHVRNFLKNKSYKCKSCVMKEKWQDEQYKLRIIESQDDLYEDSITGQMLRQKKLRNWGKSQYQDKLYKILDDLKILYSTDRQEGNYIGKCTYDCRIDPQVNIQIKKSLLIEVNGLWIHSRPEVISRDQSKATYIRRYFNNEFDLRYIWDYEFENEERVISTIKYWLGLDKPSLVVVPFVAIKINRLDYKLAEEFVSKWHYAGRIRYGIPYGFKYNDELIAVIVYSPPIRESTAIKQNVDQADMLELSRLCIHPKYQIKNLASYIIGLSIRYIRKTMPNIKMLISFADATYNHTGVIYRASNWKLDGIVPENYWYKHPSEPFIRNKKSIWDRAKKLGMAEAEYRKSLGLVKVWGDKKFRYVYKLV
jgi:hypothetical protein